MGTALKLTGLKFGKLTAIKPTDERKDKKVVWEFLCDCGNTVFTVGKYVVSGGTKSCGCLFSEIMQEKNKEKRVTLNCPICKNDFIRKKSHEEKSTYCSKECMSIAYKEILTGKDNPNFRNYTPMQKIEIARAGQKKYRMENKDVVSVNNRNARANRKLSIGKHTEKDIASMLDKQAGLCASCKCGLFGEYHVDHIIPIAKGGVNSVGNLQLLCPPCNLQKKTMLPIEFRHRILKGVSEDAEQSKLFAWSIGAVGEYPQLASMIHTPNGGYRTKATAAKMQLLGVKKGVPDIALFYPNGGYHGLYIELKVGRNKPTAEQLAWISNLNRNGYLAVVCYGFEESKKVILDYLNLPK